MCERCFSGKPIVRREVLVNVNPWRSNWQVFDKRTQTLTPFQGRRDESIDDAGFMRGMLPHVHGSRGMKGRTIRKFGAPVDPEKYAWSLRLHDLFIRMACSRPIPLTLVEIEEIRQSDAIAHGPHIPKLEGLSCKERVFSCVTAGYDDSLQIAAVSGIPFKHVSAWLSVLKQAGRIEIVSEIRLSKAGRATVVYKVNR